MSYIFDIKRYSINDGPGIRITLFLKGCPLSCIWCHNPEGISPRQSKLYTISRCIGCGLCIKACPSGALSMDLLPDGKGVVTDSGKCRLCGACASACPSRAMEMAGKEYDIEQVMKEVRKEAVFFEESGGGVTICGGEPLMHSDFLLQILDACGNEGFHRCVDTTLFAGRDIVVRTALNCELFLVDLKMMDSGKHKKFTGVNNELILDNIEYLASAGKDFIIRIPLIKGVNDDLENLTASADFLAGLQQKYMSAKSDGNVPCGTADTGFTGGKRPGSSGKRIRVELLPYHDIAKGKHARLGTIYNPSGVEMREPSGDEIAAAILIFQDRGLEV